MLVVAVSMTAACTSSADKTTAATAVVIPSLTTSVVTDADAFARTTSNGWGSADSGGAWSLGGLPPSDFSVAAGVARIQIPQAGASPTAFLYGVATRNTVSLVDFTFATAFVGTGHGYLYLAARHTARSQYRLRAKILSTGAIQLSLMKMVGRTDTVILTRISRASFSAGHFLRMRLEVTGTSSVNLAGKIWNVGSSEPTVPEVRATDATDPLVGAGSMGLAAYVPPNAAKMPISVSFANVRVGERLA